MSIDLGSVLEHMPGLLFVADAGGKLLHQSKALIDRFGTKPSVAALVGPDQRSEVEAFLAELTRVEQPVTRVLTLLTSDGQRTAVRCVGRRAPDGTIYAQLVIVEAAPDSAASNRIEHTLFRTVMETLEIVLWAVDKDGKFVFHDGKALANAGLESGQFVGQNILELYPPDLLDPVKEGMKGTSSNYRSEAHGVYWHSWIIPLRNKSGDIDYTAGLTVDVSADVKSKLELERRLATIQDQQKAIYELSAPVINVWDSVLTVPLIGVMDNERTNELIERLLAAASHSGTRYVILDLTGVDALDTSIAGHILRLLRSLRLLGVEGLVTGITPQVAQTMVGLGVDLEDVQTFRSLRESLRFCMRAMYDESRASS